MKMKLLTGFAAAAALGGGVYAQTSYEAREADTANDQTSDATREEITADKPDPELLRQRLQERAIRIPKRGLAAALRAARDGSSERAQTVEGKPDLAALREDLRLSAEADAEGGTDAALLSSPNFTAAVTAAPPPPPGIRPLAASRLKSADEKEVERAKIPVLIPADASIRDKVKVYGMANAYTATATIDKSASLSLSGTCNRVIGGDPDVVAFRKKLATEPPRLTRAGAAYHISRNDFGTDLSFSKFGCGYVMTVECDDPGVDPRCAADDYIVGLADSMILANPDLAGGE